MPAMRDAAIYFAKALPCQRKSKVMSRLNLNACLIMVFCLTAGCVSFAQGNLNHWHFGLGNGVDFSSGEPVITSSSADVLNDRIPTAYADFSGNLHFYCDHHRLYDANHNLMPDGQFATFADDATVVPHPEDANLVYLIRSLGTVGLEYTLIDLEANDGLGAIVEGQKELGFASIGGRLMVAQKADGSGHWLISADNNNGDEQCFIRTFDVTASGITEHNVFTTTWFWVGWYPTLDDARISPNCERIAVAFKGHYIGIMSYDAEAGNVVEALSSSVDNQTSFGEETRMCFSPNSQFLYTKGNGTAVSQFDVSSFNASTISTTLTTVQSDFSASYGDLQLGPDGRLYVLNGGGQFLDAILEPDQPGTACQYTPEYLALPEVTENRLPNQPNLACGAAFVLNPQVIDVCLGESTTFTLTTNQNPDAVEWDFGDGNGSSEFNPEHEYQEPGTYNVTVSVDIGEENFFFELQAEVNTFPNGFLEESYTTCQDDNFVLSPGEAETYLWSNGSNEAELPINQSGSYTVEMANGNCSVFLSTEVLVIAPPSFSVSEDLLLCDEFSAVLTASTDVEWSTGVLSNEITVTESGEYSASLSNECFVITENVSVLFVQVPELALPASSTICQGDTLELQVGLEAENLQWIGNGVEGPDGGFLVGESGTISVSGLYQGCPFEAETELEVLDFVDVDLIQMPNVFSPNGDAVNNRFRPIFAPDPSRDLCSISVLDVNLSVYNRWGGLIEDELCFWDGQTPGGDLLEEGVYYYIVDLASSCSNQGGERRVSGHLTLAR